MDDLDSRVKGALERGDTRAGATDLVRTLGPSLMGFLRATLLDPVAADDVWGMACEDLWAGLPGFAGRSSLETWAYKVTRSACARYLKGAQRRRARALSLSDRLPERAPRTPTPNWQSTPVRDAVRRLRERLTPDDRTLLVLRIDRQMSWRAIAEIEGVSPDDPAGLARREGLLRKRFERVKARLQRMAKADGLLP
ncbi:MAG: sigma-70 family RNA polymerase sigma factor [Myxococcota bacterium]